MRLSLSAFVFLNSGTIMNFLDGQKPQDLHIYEIMTSSQMAEPKRAHLKPARDFILNWCGFLQHPHVRVDGVLINQSNQKELWESLRCKSHREHKCTASKCSSPRQVSFPLSFHFFWPGFKCFFSTQATEIVQKHHIIKSWMTFLRVWTEFELFSWLPFFLISLLVIMKAAGGHFGKMSKWGNCRHLLDLRCVTFHFPQELIENILKKISLDLL